MDLFAVEHKERLGREEAAARLHALADMLARHNDVEFLRGGTRFTVRVHASQRAIVARKNARERMKTASAPASEAQYEITAPVQGPYV